jgi:hypothetical protein
MKIRIAPVNSILTTMMLAAVVGHQETINCTMDDFPLAVLHNSPSGSVLEVVMTKQCSTFLRRRNLYPLCQWLTVQLRGACCRISYFLCKSMMLATEGLPSSPFDLASYGSVSMPSQPYVQCGTTSDTSDGRRNLAVRQLNYWSTSM